MHFQVLSDWMAQNEKPTRAPGWLLQTGECQRLFWLIPPPSTLQHCIEEKAIFQKFCGDSGVRGKLVFQQYAQDTKMWQTARALAFPCSCYQCTSQKLGIPQHFPSKIQTHDGPQGEQPACFWAPGLVLPLGCPLHGCDFTAWGR